MNYIKSKRLTYIIIFLINVGINLPANCQYWDHGTRWVYRQVTQSFPIFQEYEVVADTSINGENAQKITIYSAHFITNETSDTTTFSNRIYQGDIFIKNIGDSIYWYDQGDNQFEFLFDNSPEVGDQWTNEANSFFDCGSTNLATSDQQLITEIETVEIDGISIEQAIIDPGSSWTLGFSFFVGIGPRRTFLPIPGDTCDNILINNDLIGVPSSSGLICFSNPTLGSVGVSNIIDNFNIINYDGCGDFTISTNTAKEEGLNISLYPNPASDIIYIENGDLSEVQDQFKVEVWDAVGNNIKVVQEFGFNKLRLNVSTLSSGVYFIRIFSRENEYLITKKIIIHHE